MLHVLIVLSRQSTGADYPLRWDAKDFGSLPGPLMALAAKPEEALKEKLCKQLLSLVALERLEPNGHVAIKGTGPVVTPTLGATLAVWRGTVGGERPSAATPGGASGEQSYVVHNDTHKKRQPDELVRQDPEELKRRHKEQGWVNEAKRLKHAAIEARLASGRMP